MQIAAFSHRFTPSLRPAVSFEQDRSVESKKEAWIELKRNRKKIEKSEEIEQRSNSHNGECQTCFLPYTRRSDRTSSYDGFRKVHISSFTIAKGILISIIYSELAFSPTESGREYCISSDQERNAPIRWTIPPYPGILSGLSEYDT